MTLRVLLVVGLAFLATMAEPLQEFRLPSGLRVLLVENHERPVVRLELRTSWDPAEEPAGKVGLGGFLADLLRNGGTTPAKREAIQYFLEDRALHLTFAMHPRSFAWSVLSDSQGQDGAFESLAMAATRQDFVAAVVEARRQRLLQAARERSPRLRAEERFRRRICDPTVVALPEEGSLLRIEYQDILLLARRVLRPEHSVLVVYGDMNLPQVQQLALLHLGAWGPSAEPPLARIPGAEPQPPTRTWLVREIGKEVRILVGSPRPLDLRMPPATLAICAWLAKRELAAGLAPPLASVDFQVLPEGGWTLQALARPGTGVAESMEAVQRLLIRLRGKRLEAGEWSAARLAWNMERRTRVLHPGSEASSLAAQALLSNSLEDSVDLEQVQAALGQLFAADACAYFVGGGGSQDALGLEKAGLGPVEAVN